MNINIVQRSYTYRRK